MRLVVPGATYTLTFYLRNNSGTLVDVTTPTAYFYDFTGALKTTAIPTQTAIGTYDVSLNVAWDEGSYRAFVAGTYSSATILSDILTFNIKNYVNVFTYASLEEFIKYAKIDSQVTSEEIDLQYLKDLLDYATSKINKYCKRKFFRYTTTEAQRVDNDTVMFLNEYPVISISSFTIVDDDFSTETLIDAGTYALDLRIGQIRFDVPRTGEVAITYISGVDELPEPVHQCCLDLAGYWLMRRMKAGIRSESFLGYNYTYEDSAEEAILYKIADYRLLRIL